MPGANNSLGQDVNIAGNERSAFLFTDIEGSTQRWERAPEAMRSALARHDALLRSSIQAAGGRIFKSAGDSFCAVFTEVAHALKAAAETQVQIAADGFPEVGGLKVRMAVDAGEVEARDDDYFGRPLNRVARLLAAGHGGQVLVSTRRSRLVRDTLPRGLSLIRLGLHHLRDSQNLKKSINSRRRDLPSVFPALRTLSKSRGNLPARVTSFVGRETEIEEIKSLVETNRLVTLVGSGGVGKTSTSLKVGADIVNRFQDGVVVCRTCSVDRPTPYPGDYRRALQCANRH